MSISILSECKAHITAVGSFPTARQIPFSRADIVEDLLKAKYSERHSGAYKDKSELFLAIRALGDHGLLYIQSAMVVRGVLDLGRLFREHKVRGQFEKVNAICIDINIHCHFIAKIILIINSIKNLSRLSKLT